MQNLGKNISKINNLPLADIANTLDFIERVNVDGGTQLDYDQSLKHIISEVDVTDKLVYLPLASKVGKTYSITKNSGIILGEELIVNGGFDTDTDWNKGSGWTISNGVVTYDGSTAYQLLRNLSFQYGIPGKEYIIEYDVINNLGNGGVQLRFGNFSSDYNSLTGHFKFKIIYVTGNSFRFIPQIDFTGSIDNVSVKEVIDTSSQGDFALSRASTKWVYNKQGVYVEVPIDTPAFDWSSGEPVWLIEDTYINPINGLTISADIVTPITPPAGTTQITETFADNTTNVITTIPSTYTPPFGSIKSIKFT